MALPLLRATFVNAIDNAAKLLATFWGASQNVVYAILKEGYLPGSDTP